MLEGLRQRREPAVAHQGRRTLAAEVLGCTPWREPSQTPPLAPPKSPSRLQCWVAAGQTTTSEGTQPHPSVDKWIKVLLSSAQQGNSQLYPPPFPPVRKLPQASYIASSTRGQTAEARRTTVPQPVEQKPHSQKDRQDEEAEGYVPDEGTR